MAAAFVLALKQLHLYEACSMAFIQLLGHKLGAMRKLRSDTDSVWTDNDKILADHRNR